MAIQGLPQFTLPGEEISKIPNDIMSILLKSAQTKKEGAEAAKSQLLMDLLGKSTGMGGSTQGGNTNNTSNMNFSPRELVRAMLNLPPETPDEQSKRRVEEHDQQRKFDTQAKVGEKIEEDASKLYDLKSKAQRAIEILKRRPDLTNLVAGGLSKLRLSTDKDIGTLKEIFGEIQAGITRTAGERGGAQLLGWASSIKPDVMNPGAFNMAMLTSLDRGLDDKLKTLSHRYNKKTGEKLEDAVGVYGDQENPVPNQNQSVNNSEEMITLYKGKDEYKMPAKEADMALQSGEGFSREPR